MSSVTTLDQARDSVVDQLESGSTCPCCGQFAKRYKRKLNSGMAAGLCWLVAEFLRRGSIRNLYINVQEDAPRFVMRSNEIHKLRHWGLIEAKPNDHLNRKPMGMWRPTLLGVAFAQNAIEVPTYIFLYNGDLLGTSEETTDIIQALNNKFDYTELMRS